MAVELQKHGLVEPVQVGAEGFLARLAEFVLDVERGLNLQLLFLVLLGRPLGLNQTYGENAIREKSL